MCSGEGKAVRPPRAPECTSVFQVTPTEQHPPHLPYRPLRVLPPGRVPKPSCRFKGRFLTLSRKFLCSPLLPHVYQTERLLGVHGRLGGQTKDKLAIYTASWSPCPLPDSGQRGRGVGLGTLGACRDLFCQQEGPAPASAMEGKGVLLGKI